MYPGYHIHMNPLKTSYTSSKGGAGVGIRCFAKGFQLFLGVVFCAILLLGCDKTHALGMLYGSNPLGSELTP